MLGLSIIWMIFATCFLALVPLKIFSSFFAIAFVESYIFLWISGAMIGATMILCCFAKIKIKNIDVRKNFFLGLISIALTVGFGWCTSTYFCDTSKYDFAWQPLLMSILSILSCITFILAAITFFTGKNMFSYASFFLFCPVLWFILLMIMYLSIYNNNPDVYEISLTAGLSLFLIYNTQIFSTSSTSNNTKLMFFFGIPSVILSACHCIPTVINYFANNGISEVSASTCMIELLLSCYIVLILAEAHKQIHEPKEPNIRSISIR